MNLSAENFIDELKSGNQKAFEDIFKKYYSLLCYEARGYIQSNDLIEEIVCDIFTRIWLNRETLVIRTSLREYLIKAVHNNCIDYYRQLKRQDNLKANLEAKEQIHYTLTDLGETPLDYILTQELEDEINAAIESLPPKYKETFKLSRFSDLTYEEIATQMNISINSVKTNIKNALAILREKLNNFLLLAYIFLIRSIF
jgi:RNA polymerase sigma-70 factor (ECF subfamily)